jgi:hypothetical protein
MFVEIDFHHRHRLSISLQYSSFRLVPSVQLDLGQKAMHRSRRHGDGISGDAIDTGHIFSSVIP